MSVGETSSKVSSSKRLNSESDIQDIETHIAHIVDQSILLNGESDIQDIRVPNHC